LLDVVNPNTPSSKARPKGVIATLVFCYVGADPPTSLKQYNCVGLALRGRFLNVLGMPETTGQVKINAYYFARYAMVTGKLGEAGNVEVVEAVW
jgi:hypothetical protein